MGWCGDHLFASMVAMYIRQILASRHLHPQINFCITAFVATTISGLLLTLPTFSNTPTIAMAASVLLLVPGFPLINSVADMFKDTLIPDSLAGLLPVCLRWRPVLA